VADTLPDAAWADICAAAAGHIPDVEARAELSTILFKEYPGVFAYDRARVAAAYKRAGQMLKHLDAFAKLYRQT
jgi:hypothetical protein